MLLLENSGPHGDNLLDLSGQTTILFLPPICKAIHQPIDMGIISAWKTLYRGMMLRQIMEDIDTRQVWRDGNKDHWAGMKGLAKCFDPHVFDVTLFVKQSRDAVKTDTISRCWIKSKALPINMETQLSASYGKMKSCSDHESVKRSQKWSIINLC